MEFITWTSIKHQVVETWRETTSEAIYDGRSPVPAQTGWQNPPWYKSLSENRAPTRAPPSFWPKPMVYDNCPRPGPILFLIFRQKPYTSTSSIFVVIYSRWYQQYTHWIYFYTSWLVESHLIPVLLACFSHEISQKEQTSTNHRITSNQHQASLVGGFNHLEKY